MLTSMSGTCNNRMRTRIATIAGIAALCATAAVAQMNGGTAQQGTPSGSPSSASQAPNGRMNNTDRTMAGMDQGGGSMGTMGMDKMFVRKALQGGMAEVELGQLALTKTSNDDIKTFAQKMIDDHTKMGEDMKGVAQQVGVAVPKRLSNKDMAIKSKLSSLNGAAFDKSYLKDMVKDHEQDEKDFKDESMNGKIPQVKDAATTGEQTISMHLQMVKDLASKNGVKSE